LFHLIAVEFKCEFIAFFRRPAYRTREERSSHAFKRGILRQTDREAGSPLIDVIEYFGGSEAGVKTKGCCLGQLHCLVDDVVNTVKRPFRRSGVAVPKHGVDEALSQALRIESAVCREAGGQGRADGFAVVTIIGRSGLLAVSLNGEAVDVHDAKADFLVVRALALMTEYRGEEMQANGFASMPSRKYVHSP
jgi:hypothetical protein